MYRDKEIKLAAALHLIARYTSLILSSLVFMFALLSGAENGAGLSGIIHNSPDALPWLSLLVVVFIAWRWEVAGGILIITLGVTVLYVFNFPTADFTSTISILAFLIILIGTFFILSWFLALDKR